jgi:cytochrome oxidase Cu insertion factor (SCO1/SenC/PrrC family)
MPELQKVHAKYKSQGLVLIAVHCDPDVAKRDATVKSRKVTYPVAQAIGDKSPKDYRINGYPTVYLIDRKGVIRSVDPPDLEKAVKAILE